MRDNINMIKVINWNVSYANNKENKFSSIYNSADKYTIIILEEVTPKHYEELKEVFYDCNIEYSLNYRKPGKFDTKQRQLGIAIITTEDLPILSAKCLDRCLLPERTLLVEIKYGHKPLRVLGLHSITGCDHKKAKSMQFYSFAEAIDEYKPDIVGMDANEPEVDHYDVSKMKFFDNKDKGKGAQTFFNTLVENALYDAYAPHYRKYEYRSTKPLTVSHKVSGKIDKRYDFIFTNRGLGDCRYAYAEGIAYGSDHAIIECDIKPHIKMHSREQ